MNSYPVLCISQLKLRPPDPRGIAGDSGDLTRLMRGFNTQLTTCCPRGAVELTRYSFDPGHERGFNTHAMDMFFLGFRQKRPLATCNANAQGCSFSKWRTSQRGKEKNQSGLATNTLRTPAARKKSSKLCDIEVMEVDEANRKD